MRRLALVNGKVVHAEVIGEMQNANVLNYEGFYDTVVDDDDETMNVGDTYDIDSYIAHYFPEQLIPQPAPVTPTTEEQQ